MKNKIFIFISENEMNIFFLHINPKQCAKWHVDRHVIKMILETAQLLCSAIWICGYEDANKEVNPPYKLTHSNHPCAIWCRANKENWNWLKELGLALCEEYTFRYGKKHKTQSIIENLVCPKLKNEPFFEPPQAMPEQYKIKNDSIMAYRLLYAIGKRHLHTWKTRHAWKNREIPNFVNDILKRIEVK